MSSFYFLSFFLIIFTVNGFFVENIITPQDWEDKIFDAIESTISYYLNTDVNNLDTSLMLGVSIMKGQMLSCAKNFKMNRKSFNLLNRSYAISKMANKLNDRFFKANITVSKITKRILDNNLWTSFRKFIWKTHVIPISDFDMKSMASEDLFFQNVSDTCILELLTDCRPSTKCIRSELEDNFLGYALTHQVLYIHILKKMKCLKHNIQIILDGFIQDKCNTMVNEAEYMINSPNILYDYRDLFIEQIAVCGMENMIDFIRPEWLSFILSLQNQQGCFQNAIEKQFDCDTHLTGVSLAALGVYWKFLCYHNNMESTIDTSEQT
ncbi:UPF0764 protein C16orf89 homolog isoform X3 [Daktulosphaira vitifoliae]|uniref:UPF0764 protein C16orf89 homolog isoform X2 n=1 Tax=Daktulosphaira vitifoliae TaxID=58002 RepID=UPI0021AA9BCB|nr:UPF0764 protein C16orf89 homolog isoform X2 [Daktulosphaira vitifoliae]XP_050541128.1 UPF0764 protein C16orf89 homolog isoform X3 [Daktulosphaira vitifoliae]